MTGRVLQVLGRSAGGIAKHVSQITGALDGTGGLEVDVAGPRDLPISMPKIAIDLDIPSGLNGHLGAVKKLRAIVREGGYDVVHAHGLRAGVDSALAVRGDAYVIATVHNLVQREIAGARAVVDRIAEPAVVRLTHKTLAVSQQIADRLTSVGGPHARKVEVLYLGIGDAPAVARERDEVRTQLGVPEPACLVVAVARLAPQKALPVMFEALQRTTSDMYLAILGEGPLEEALRADVFSRGLEDRVRFLGFRPDVADYVSAADVFCLSSTWEGVPLSVQEAVLLGTVVVSTDVGGMGEIVIDRHSGRLVPNGDSAALADALDEVCRDPELRSSLSARARADLQQRFSTDRMLERLRSLYAEAARA